MSETAIRIQLPLPLDVAATLVELIGKAYPEAQLTDPGFGGREINIVIPERARAKRVSKAAAAAAKTVAEPDTLTVTQAAPGDMAFSCPEDLAAAMLSVITATFADHPEAENYLEFNLVDKATHTPWNMTFARSKAQTPAALREAAEARAERAEARVRELEEQLREREDHDAAGE